MNGRFIDEIPVKGFSKHDDPIEVARILEESTKQFLKKWENFAGFVPFDIKKTTARFDDGLPAPSDSERNPFTG